MTGSEKYGSLSDELRLFGSMSRCSHSHDGKPSANEIMYLMYCVHEHRHIMRLHNSDAFDFDEDILRQPGNLDRRASRLMIAEELGINLVDSREVVHIL